MIAEVTKIPAYLHVLNHSYIFRQLTIVIAFATHDKCAISASQNWGPLNAFGVVCKKVYEDWL